MMTVNPNNLSTTQLTTEIEKALSIGDWNYLGTVSDIAQMKLREYFDPPPRVWIWTGADGDTWDITIAHFNDIELNFPYTIRRHQSGIQEASARLIMSQAVEPHWWKGALVWLLANLVKLKLKSQ